MVRASEVQKLSTMEIKIPTALPKLSTFVHSEPFFECALCEINNLDRMCPCPRGGCVAEHKGEIVVTAKIERTKPQS